MREYQNIITDFSPFALNNQDELNGNSRSGRIQSLASFQSKLEMIAEQLVMGSRRECYDVSLHARQRLVEIPKKGNICGLLFRRFGLPFDTYEIFLPLVLLNYDYSSGLIDFKPATSGRKYASIDVYARSGNKVALQKARQISNILGYGNGYLPIQFDPTQSKNKTLEILFPTIALSEASLKNIFHVKFDKPEITDEHVAAYFKSLPSK